ncbi:MULTISPECIES: KpsF/GutQ family sugar-phosphate isomerase [Flavobacterium]|uniref:KpsF/GutQ family sugar-phosphate isomerase n=1 Tax=Flavobacterium stagni TaxID=2506421 RepID=A0A4Q1K6Z0_9FLAO|nr:MULTISPECIES: KpsF/GutQ family sugar-phosphate isomerase [Flavobacterium]RXR21837.1 KpsF/GutQ family sugar-phosphate isomerase [Flavobacterium stagni]
MITKEAILTSAKRTLLSESASIAKLTDFIDDTFATIAELIYQSNGRLVVTGIGKSAIIAQKIVATLNSTGTPALFLHASEAIHGDLGMVQPGDPIICISKSGNSPEIKVLAPLLKRNGNTLIGMTGNPESYLGKESHYILNTWVAAESDPNNLAPTNSTTAQLAMGDALAVCLIEMRNFSAEDFAMYHPGGALGKKLLLKVNDLLEASRRPEVRPDTSIKNVIVSISEGRLGVTTVVENQKVVGIITDGDIRRMLNKTETITGLTAQDIMSVNPKHIQSDTLVVDALNTMENYAITQLIVVDEGEYKGVIHLHDILKEGVV